MKEMSRAVRRHHAARLKKARRFYFGIDNSLYPGRLGKVLNTPHPCSCAMCCNWRETEGRTLAERIHIIDLVEF
jgi:hypothetical protein